jgi:ribosomal protein S18 acetylase RimI-like enzyme
MTLALESQPFDGEMLGVPVARLTVPRCVASGILADAVGDWRHQGLGLVSCRVPEAWHAERSALVHAGFREIETLVTYQRGPLPPPLVPAAVRAARDDDRDACMAIAARAFRHDRYHVDPAIDDEAADRLKARWVANAFAGRAAARLVADVGHGPVGFALGLTRGDAGLLDLIAVAPEAQGRGLGAALLAGFVAHYAGRATRAGTQEANRASCRLYERAGYAVVARDVTLHWTPS